ncbi:DUF6531 domain-containing protein [Micromonospora musae]|uniref:Type IV secretion protein Rhs n=1 Tax=Micromonospora musae TaxID=1894970 RepID=A0A3A9XX29_9ACTN|nr:DUF6531 domain-containing protein [Micromonospora musae]RKN29678.1 type IV secretion protein Rhs [Micromonospora musae]
MTRPGDAEWSVLQLDSDPVPGDPESFEEITRAYQELARSTQEAHDLLASGSQIDVGQGKAMEAFRDLIGKLPGRLDGMAHSYAAAADAYLRYLPSLEEAQKMSVQALEQARQASGDQGAAQAAVSAAQAAITALGGDPEAAQAAKDKATDDATAAQNRADEARQALDQAKALIGQATALRDQAARTAAGTLRQLAKDAPQRSLWDKIVEAFEAFIEFLRSTVIQWITTVLDVISVIASFIFPPLGEAIGLLSGAIDLASAVLGGDPAEIGLAAGGLALGLIPGGRAGALVMKFAAKGGKALGLAGDGVKGATRGLNGGGGKTIGGALPGKGAGANRPPVPKDTSLSIDVRKCVTDPIDVATGEMVLSQIDLELPAPFLVPLERTHLSSYRAGGWFGPSWASTLDQRLEFDAQGVCYFAPDGTILVYPPGTPGEPVLPVEGPRWPLTVHADGTAVVTDPVAGRSSLFLLSGAVSRLAAVVDGDGNRLEVARDARQAPVALRHADGQWIAVSTSGNRVTALHRTDPGGRPTELIARYRYDEQGRLVEVDNTSGRPMRFGYDEAGRITGWHDRNGVEYRYTYDASGRCVRTEGADGFLNGTLAYDPTERTTTYTDSLGNVTVYRLDDLRHVASETDPLGNTTRYEWGRYNQLLARIDPLGRTTRYEYDADGRLSTLIRPDGTEAQVTSGGDAAAGTIAVQVGERLLTRSYDTAPDPDGGQVGVAEPFDYDRLRADDPVRDAALAGRRAHRLDARGRLERVRYDDEGNPIERTDAAGHVTRTEYGPFDLVLATVDATGARTGYEYDAELRLTRVTDPRGLQWRYTYDPAGRLVEEVDFNGRVRRYDYDAAGQLVRSTNGLGEVTEYEHDLLGNVVERRTGSGTTRYRYDAVGRLVAAENADAELVIERDEAGRVVAHTTNGRTLSFRYDDRTGARHRRTPHGSESVWAYDPFGNLDSLVTAGHTLGFRHDWQGRELRRSLDGQVVLEQTFGADRQLAAQVLPGLRQRRFDYRADGLLAGIDEDVTGRVDFTLDEAGRVLAVRGTGRVEDYRYDATGNLTSARVSGLPYAGELRYDGNLVTEAGGVRYRYDAQGRMVGRTLTDPAGGDRTWHFEWDAHDRLVGVRTPEGDRWRYRYDPLGRRIGKQRFVGDDPAPVEQVDFVWDGSLLVEQAQTDEHGRTRVTSWEYHPQEQRPVAQTVRDERDELGERFYAIVTDLVGTPTDLVDADGALVWRNDASLWGVAPGADASGMIPLRFPGQYLDPETGLHYNVYRYYDPISGRYVSQDPLGLAPAPDPAGYVPNPYAAADPLGLACTAGSSSGTPGSPGGGTDARSLPDTAGSSGGNRPLFGGESLDNVDDTFPPIPNRPRPDQRPDDLGAPDAELYDLSNPIHRARPIQPNPPRPSALFHGSSAPPDVVFQDGLKSRHTQEVLGTPEGDYVQPHYDLFKHMHNGKGSGFVSTTGSQDAALSFVRPTPLPDRPGFKKGTAADGKQYDHHDGYLYVVDNDLPAIHAPSQNLPPVLDRVRYQDEWSVVGDIPPDRIIKAIHVEGYYNTNSGTMPDPYRPGQTIPTVSLEFPNDPKLGTVQTVEHNPNYGRRR